MRQFPSRYSFRALRNLPEKEMRSFMLQLRSREADMYFYIPLYVAIQIGLYHHTRVISCVWRVVSEDSRTVVRAFPADCPSMPCSIPPNTFSLPERIQMSSIGYTDIPAFSQILLRLAFQADLRTIHVVAISFTRDG